MRLNVYSSWRNRCAPVYNATGVSSSNKTKGRSRRSNDELVPFFHCTTPGNAGVSEYVQLTPAKGRRQELSRACRQGAGMLRRLEVVSTGSRPQVDECAGAHGEHDYITQAC